MKEHIDEMAKVLIDYTNKNHIMASHVILEDYAEALYNAGYRKQEWISVEERLPTHQDGKVLIYTAYGISIAERTVNNRWRGDCAIPKLITHWMPLPEAPKMKGGAE